MRDVDQEKVDFINGIFNCDMVDSEDIIGIYGKYPNVALARAAKALGQHDGDYEYKR